MRRPRVSIGMPVYNGEPFVREAIASVLAQDLEDLELVISDNASTDATEEICRAAASGDARVSYERLPVNVGAARNYNAVFERARGTLFRWHAADDRVAPGHLRACVDALEQGGSEIAVAYPRTRRIGPGGDPLGDYDDRLDLRDPAPHARLARLLVNLRLCNAVFGLMRRDVLARTRLIGGFVSSDQVLLAELALRGTFVEVPEPLFERRVHAGASQFAHATADELAAWFEPKHRDAHVSPRSRLLAELVAAVGRAPLPAAERARCIWIVQRCWLPRHWRAIGGELKTRLRDLLPSRRAS